MGSFACLLEGIAVTTYIENEETLKRVDGNLLLCNQTSSDFKGIGKVFSSAIGRKHQLDDDMRAKSKASNKRRSIFNIKNNILFAGDPHGAFQPLIDAVKERRPTAVILMGDMQLKERLEVCLDEIIGLTEIYWIPGNHDYEEPYYSNLFDSSLAGNNLDGRVVEIDGVRVAGLGGTFKGKIWYPKDNQGMKHKTRDGFYQQLPSNQIKSGYKKSDGYLPGCLSLGYEGAIWPEDYGRMLKMEADILVTHESPRHQEKGFDALADLGKGMGVELIVHGHLHDHYKDLLGNGIQVFGTPMAGVIDINGRLL